LFPAAAKDGMLRFKNNRRGEDRMVRRLDALLAGAVLVVAVAGNAAADPVADFYRGKTITYLQASGPGGGFAVYSRLIEKYLPQFIPGHPKIQLQFMPGAGGVKAANYAYNVAPRDGSFMGMPLNTVALYQVLRPKSVKYDAAKFTWLIGLVELNSVILVWHTSPAKTLEEARKVPVVIASTAKSADNYEQPMLANALLGTRFKVVTGYHGSQGMSLAMERGEANGKMTFWVSLVATKPDWIRDKKVIPLLQVGVHPIKALPTVPRMIDLVKSARDKAVVRLLHINAALGRTLYAPPGVPKERADALRRAVTAMTKDPAFLAEAARRQVEIDPTPADELHALIVDALHTPQDAVERFKQAVELN
jgi:tripartite-type tricarboxylate transporter receptor subunit TctC